MGRRAHWADKERRGSRCQDVLQTATMGHNLARVDKAICKQICHDLGRASSSAIHSISGPRCVRLLRRCWAVAIPPQATSPSSVPIASKRRLFTMLKERAWTVEMRQ